MQKGMTLMSVMVATALSGVIGLMVIRLISNQAEAMLIVKLREEREVLIKHYRQVVIGGWDNTMAGGTSTVYARGVAGKTSFPISLGEDLYKHDANGWWTVTATSRSATPNVGKIQRSDAYSGTTGLHDEQNYAVTLKVEFDPTKHEVAKMKLAPRVEVIYLGHRWAKAKQGGDAGCGSDSATALTRRDTTLTTAGKPLYHPNAQGAIVSYSFHSNYVKCSQVPLIENQGECPAVSGWLGFESRGTGASDNPFYRRAHGLNEYVTGRIACSYPDNSDPSNDKGKWRTAISAKGGPWYRLGRTLKDDGNVGDGGDKKCSDHDLSYIDKITKIRDLDTGTGGGELLCEPTFIAPQVFKHYYSGMTRTALHLSVDSTSKLGSYAFNGNAVQPGPLATCTPYRSYSGTGYDDYDDHVGYGGYTDDHSGGLKEFVSTGSGSGARTDPFEEQEHSRGVPGDRGDPGECQCGNP